MLRVLREDSRYRGQIVHDQRFVPRPARYRALRRPLRATLTDALGRRGIAQLYTHQAEAVEAVRDGESIIVTTGTASGKSLCYMLPVLETLLSDPAARALFVYPTKALAQDQLEALGKFDLDLRFGAYDGDTPQAERPRLRGEARILLTNPDMLHVGILPQHFRWTSFLRHLRMVVLDDMHVYRGVFGSHVANIIRRLIRVCRLRGADPQIICTSATVANPDEFGRRLTGRPLRVIDDDGAPRGPRIFALWNPPVIDRAKMTRRSPYTEAGWLLADLIRGDVRTIAFTKARKVTELVHRYAAEALRETPELAARISPYRAGYLPEQRRAIERRLFGGDLVGVVSTSALELGIDVGGLDASVLVGYPGTMASVWQRVGRAGRGQEESLAVMIALEDALDQYLMAGRITFSAARWSTPRWIRRTRTSSPPTCAARQARCRCGRATRRCSARECGKSPARLRGRGIWCAVGTAGTRGRGATPRDQSRSAASPARPTGSFTPGRGGSWARWMLSAPSSRCTRGRSTCTRGRPTG